MATSKSIISSKFENGDIPSEGDFQQIFDSFLHKDDDRASFQMVQTGTDRDHYVTPELLHSGLQNLGIITGNCYMPYKENLESTPLQTNTLNLTYIPIVDSVRVYKNGQLLTEDKDYVVDYNTAVITFSSPVANRNIEVDYWYKNFGPVPGGTDITDLSSKYVDLTSNQSIGGNKTFTSAVKSTAFVKTGGTPNQYLMADGSVSSSNANDYDAGHSGFGIVATGGYQKFSNGLILQWARLSSGTTTYSFPLSWPHMAFSVVLSTYRSTSGSRGTNHVTNVSQTTYYAVIDGSSGYMFAIGY